MPCTYYTQGEQEALQRQAAEKQVIELTTKLNEVTDLLCKVCTNLEGKWQMPAEVWKWWEAHQKTDRNRKARARYDTAMRSLTGIKKVVEDVRTMGGEPAESLKAALADAKRELKAATEELEKSR